MQSIKNTVCVETHEKQQLLNLTSQIRQAVEASGIQSGFAGIYSQHTTASVFVTECQSPFDDVTTFFRLVGTNSYKHNSRSSRL
jgi:thiamine phosphate synthase YjbQ (UPF0047 family)